MAQRAATGVRSEVRLSPVFERIANENETETETETETEVALRCGEKLTQLFAKINV